MPKGGFRPGGGRPSRWVYHIGNNVYYSLDEAASAEGVSKMTISRWCRPGGKDGCSRDEAEKTIDDSGNNSETDMAGYSEKAEVKPLDFWRYILDHPDKYDKKDRMQAAYYAAPYIHPKATSGKGKKEQRKDRAGKASVGRFRPSLPPPLKAVK